MPNKSSTLCLHLQTIISDPFFVGEMPLPPGVNARYKKVHIRLKEGRENTNVLTAIRQSKEKIPLASSIVIYFPTLWQRDIDGGEKAAIDATFARLGINDNLVVDKDTKQRVDDKNPRIEIAVSCVLTGGE